LVHKLDDVPRLQFLTKNFQCLAMVHDHDIVCMRRHKYFPLTTKICHHAASWRCYAHACMVQKSASGGLRLGSLAAQKRLIKAYQGMHKLLVASSWMQEELLMNGFKQAQVKCFPYAAKGAENIEVLPPSPHRELLYVGQIIRSKGLDYFLRSLSALQGEWRVNIIGDGNMMEECQALIKSLGMEQKVRMLGRVDHQQLAAYYASARFTVFPSRWPEPQGLTGLEAMAYGRPVVGFAVGGVPDWLQHEQNGLLVAPADVAGLTAAMQRLLDDDALVQRLGRQAAKDVRQHYGYASFTHRLQAEIMETVAKA